MGCCEVAAVTGRGDISLAGASPAACGPLPKRTVRTARVALLLHQPDSAYVTACVTSSLAPPDVAS